MKHIEAFKTQRLLSLDVFRGITIALMIFVNTLFLSPYPTLKHSVWNGCSLADLIFPVFLFVVGVSLVFSLSKQIGQEPASTVMRKTVQRTLILFTLGLILNAVPYHMTPEAIVTIRFFGVLQRIALCYLCVSLVYLTMTTAKQALLFMVILIGYWVVMMYVPLPGYGIGQLTPEGNVAAYFDRLLFSSSRLYGKVYDPEGLLSTLPAIATTLLGSLTGTWLRSKATAHQKLLGMVGVGSLCLIAGGFWGQWFPINKALWTSSYVLWTGGWALYGFALCYWLIDVKQYQRWSKPFEIFGLNAIFVYFFHVLCLKIQYAISMSCEHGSSCHLVTYISEHLFGWVSPSYVGLYYSLSSVLFWFLIVWILYRHKIFIRV